MSDEEARSRGQEAQRLLANPLFVEAFDAVENALIGKMRHSQSDEVVLAARRYLGILADVRSYVSSVATNGVIAAQTIKVDEERKAVEAKRKWWNVVGTAR